MGSTKRTTKHATTLAGRIGDVRYNDDGTATLTMVRRDGDDMAIGPVRLIVENPPEYPLMMEAVDCEITGSESLIWMQGRVWAGRRSRTRIRLSAAEKS